MNAVRVGVACFMTTLAFALPGAAELQNVEVGGEIRIRCRYWRNAVGTRRVSQNSSLYAGIPIGPFGFANNYDWDDRGSNRKYVEQRTSLHVKADFTDDVTAFVEFDTNDVWGTDFRSDYRTGRDSRTPTSDDVEVYQSYIETRNTFGLPLRVRIGRQVLKFGKGWLVWPSACSPVTLNSFDAVRLTYGVDDWTVDAWWAKLAESRAAEEDGDVDFYGVYGTYAGFEPLSLSAYWMWVRDARSLNDTNFVWLMEWIEGVFGLDDYDVTNLHTIGVRGWGETGPWDYDLELAYQFGEADQHGFGFRQVLYGDDDAEYDNWAGDLEIGYTFDCRFNPRVSLGGAYFEGHDERNISFLEWVTASESDASVSFNRLFSRFCYTSLQDNFADLSNFWQIRLGAKAQFTDSISLRAQVAYFGVVDEFHHLPDFQLGPFAVPIAPALSFWTEETDDDFAIITKMWLRYDYSEDLWFMLVWEHGFMDDGATDGNFIARNGQLWSGGTDDQDADYIQLYMNLKF